MRREIEQFTKNAADVFFEVYKYDDNRQIAACFHETRRVDLISAIEASLSMKRTSSCNILLSKHLQNLMPLVAFVQIHRDLDGSFHSNPYKLRANTAPSATA
jgi:hypothetical protein